MKRSPAIALVVAALFVVLAGTATAGSGSGSGSVSGSGLGSGAVAGDQLQLGAQSSGGLASGHAQNQFTLGSSQFNSGGSIVCLSVSGNRAIVLYNLREPIAVPELPGEVFPYGAAYIEDNGDPVNGQPVDRMVDFAVQAQNAHFFCDNPSFDFFASLAAPIASGNYVIQHQ
jgi:hypothetical protein